MIARLKKIIQAQAEKLGYRIVPRNRDAHTLLGYAEKLTITAVVDVGANIGLTCLHWLRTFPLAHVHAVEALERFQPALERVAETSSGRMSIWPFAASDSAEELSFHIHEDHPSSSSLLAATAESHALLPFTETSKKVLVQAVRLDELFARSDVNLGQSIFLKLDVQGAELRVLHGCSGFLRDVACVLCEINLQSLYEGQARFVDIIAYLDGFGLELAGIAEQFHTDDGRAIYFDAVFLRSSTTPTSRA